MSDVFARANDRYWNAVAKRTEMEAAEIEADVAARSSPATAPAYSSSTPSSSRPRRRKTSWQVPVPPARLEQSAEPVRGETVRQSINRALGRR